MKRSITHATFRLERHFAHAAPAKVFAAFSNKANKSKWFKGPEEWGPDEGTMDFRVGGRETSRGGPKGGPKHSFECIYQDIVPDQRIVYSYDMHMDDTRISVSLATIEIEPEGKGSKLVLTEMGAFLDGHDSVNSREGGTKDLLDKLGRSLKA